MTIRNIPNAIVILFFILIISSCSNTRILYNNSDLLILNKFDTYFDLNNTQRLDLKMSITEFLDWHRNTELSLLAVSLQELKSRYQRGMREEDFDWINRPIYYFPEKNSSSCRTCSDYFFFNP